MNSQISFEEYLRLAKSAFMYEARNNPVWHYDLGFGNLNEYDGNSDGEEKDMGFDFDTISDPKQVLSTPKFRDIVKERYSNNVYTSLLEREYFTKVEALEEFANLWSIGLYPKKIPRHNTFKFSESMYTMPKFQNFDAAIKPDPNFFDLRKEDDHRSVESAFQPASTMKPEPFFPQTRPKEKDEDEYARVMTYIKNDPKQIRDWNRISRSKKDKWRAVHTDFPTYWKFSTFTRPGQFLSEEKEAELIEKFNNLVDGKK